MSIYALCLVGPNLTRPKIEILQANLRTWSIVVQDSKWLSPGYALDLYLEGIDGGKTPLVLQQVSRSLPQVDAALIAKEGRRKQLLIADMDSTLIAEESIIEMAAKMGVEQAVASLTNQAMQGKIDFNQALFERVKLLKGMRIEDIQAIARAATLNPGAQTLCATMRAHGARLLMVSGGFNQICQSVADRLHIDRYVANTLAIAGGKLTGGLGLPIVDAEMKGDVLRQECLAQNINTDQVLAVGDGANDIEMLNMAGLAVAYYGKPALQKVAGACINYTDLRTLLYFQGYEDAQIQMAD